MSTKRTAADPAPAAAAAPPPTVTRTLAREVIHEGALRRPGEVVTLPAAAAAVLEPEGYFVPATAGTLPAAAGEEA